MKTSRVGFLRRSLVTVSSQKPVKRFYQDASVEESNGLWRVLLDSKVLKTPKRVPLELPSRAVAERTAQEWRSQGEFLKPKQMPLTTIGCTTVDIVRHDTAAAVRRLMPFLEMDTICFEDDQELLAERQRQECGPLRRWFEEHFGVTLAVATGLSAPAHPEETLTIIDAKLRGRSEWELCALEIATSTAKSLIVATALLDRPDVSPEIALRLSSLEERFQIERWGLVEGEHDVANQEAKIWLEAAKCFGKDYQERSE